MPARTTLRFLEDYFPVVRVLSRKKQRTAGVTNVGNLSHRDPSKLTICDAALPTQGLALRIVVEVVYGFESAVAVTINASAREEKSRC